MMLEASSKALTPPTPFSDGAVSVSHSLSISEGESPLWFVDVEPKGNEVKQAVEMHPSLTLWL